MRWQAVPLLMLIAGLLCLALGIHRVQLKAYETRAIRRSALHAAVVAGRGGGDRRHGRLD